jgi:dGTPase
MQFNRSQLEEIENVSLASYGVHSKDTKGRRFTEDEPEYRTCFQRDRDRIVHTTSFRRLEYKTQVFINYEGDHYRTRLTHTLEVAQIGRSIARALGANEDLVEAICLAHDLGHPPFGHSGEAILSHLMNEFGGFEHNRHSYRIVTQLENRFPNFPGLNLTWEVLEGIVKHETEYDMSFAEGYNPELRGHLEAQITNCADELAYVAHDLDDGLASGIINSDMLNDIEIWKLIIREIGWQGGQLDQMTRHIIIREMIGLEVTDLVSTTSKAIDKSGISTVDGLQRLSYNVASLSEDLIGYNQQLKYFLFDCLYKHYRVMRMEKKAEQIITDLFHSYQTEPAILPSHVQTAIEINGLERTICDYIAGMTDRFAIEEHKKLFDPSILP